MGALSGTDQPLGRPRVTRLLKVIGNGIRVGIGLGRQRFGSPAVPEPAAGRQHALVERLPRQRVDEADARTIALRLQQVGLDRPFDDRQQRLLTHLPDIRPEVEGHLLTDYGRDRQRGARLLAQAAYSTIDYLPQQRRHDHSVELTEDPAVRIGWSTPSSTRARRSSVAKNGLPSACRSR